MIWEGMTSSHADTNLNNLTARVEVVPSRERPSIFKTMTLTMHQIYALAAFCSPRYHSTVRRSPSSKFTLGL